jgi:3-hydroxyacyl-[acyl-carrier-protein] dehydratase
MLKDSFFTIEGITETEKGRTYRVALNALHPVFLAHFAGSPVMPGACVVQMIKELAEESLSVPFFIATVKNMKFLKVINPLENPEISVLMTCTVQENDSVRVSFVINDGDTVFSKAILVLNPVKKQVSRATGSC